MLGDDRRLDTMPDEQPQKLERNVGDDLEMHRTMVAHAKPVDGVDVRAAPQHVQLIILVDAVDDALETRVMARGHANEYVANQGERGRFWPRFSGKIKSLGRNNLCRRLVLIVSHRGLPLRIHWAVAFVRKGGHRSVACRRL